MKNQTLNKSFTLSNKLRLFTLFYLFVHNINAQTSYILNTKIAIPDHPEYHDDREMEREDSHNDEYHPLSIPIYISDLPVSLGLEKVIISIKHPRISDIKVELFSPDSTLVWLTNRNGKQGQDYDSTVFSQKGFNGPISSAKAPFRGEFQPDGNLSAFNNGQKHNGTWWLRISDLAHDTEGVFEQVSLVFSENPARQNISPCSLKNPKGCICSRPDGRLLPDLVVSMSGTADNMHEVAFDPAKNYGLLMFEVRAMNLGEGPLELEGSNIWLCGKDTVASRYVQCKMGDVTHDSVYPRQIFRQNIYALQNGDIVKTSREAGTMAYDGHPGHDHFHADYYARFTLIEPNESEPDTNRWRVVGTARKASFCLWDMQFCDAANGKCDYNGKIFDEKTLLNYGFGTYQSCDDPKRQGISVGGIDWYGLHYDGQNLRLPAGIRNGLYYLKIEIDPFNYYEEADENNNTLFLPIILRFQEYPHENPIILPHNTEGYKTKRKTAKD